MKRTFSPGRRFRARTVRARPRGDEGPNRVLVIGPSKGVPGGKRIVEPDNPEPGRFQRLREWMKDVCIIVHNDNSGWHRGTHGFAVGKTSRAKEFHRL
jgi:hypothetical protein